MRQPSTEDETDAAIRAVWASCCGAVRYGGSDPQILVRFAELDLSNQCDGELPSDHTRIVRNCARFEYGAPNGFLARRRALRQIIHQIAEALEAYPGHECFAFRRWSREASFRVRWGKFGKERGHTVRFKVVYQSASSWLLRISDNDVALTAFAIHVDKALQQKAGFRSIRWFDDSQASCDERGQRHPY